MARMRCRDELGPSVTFLALSSYDFVIVHSIAFCLYDV